MITLENMEPMSCIVARVLGGSLASIPSKALVSDIIRRSLNMSASLTSSVSIDDEDKDIKNSDLPEKATDVTAVFN